MKLPVEDRALMSAELAASVAPQIGDEQASAIDEMLFTRIGGPFVPFDPEDGAFWDGIESEVRFELRLVPDPDASS
ncbi:hypothetical protein BH23VER1_BH23VER1_29020 [soil metagenome]